MLGYIFEKYINQKEMGAYYTKEDITGYICRNTILPFLFDKLANYRYEAVNPLPVRDIEPYIYPAVAQEEHLPTETEREYQARRARLEAIRADFAAGKIASIDDFITYNLDMERFVQDWLRELTDPLTLRAFYFECLTKLTVLDPTVGSGAFLFAAMNILEPLYEACLDKMEELGDSKFPDFQRQLARIAGHPNRRYFIFKSIVVNNLYGVDVMEEATEICKLRLFLKLVAQLEPGHPIEPLPDIDFNIRAGNSLVGYASAREIEAAGQRSLFQMNVAAKVREVDTQLQSYRLLQTEMGIAPGVLAAAKTETQAKLREVELELNEALRAEYGAPGLAAFVSTHRPFHWWLEFNAIMQDGGFDVIIGNPPYVEYSKIKSQYTVREYRTEQCGNLYAFITERSLSLLREEGRFGMIVPVSSACTDGYSTLQKLLIEQKRCYASFYNDRPGRLFDGIEHCRLSILLTLKGRTGGSGQLFTTAYHKWASEFRPFLFSIIFYLESTGFTREGAFAKLGSGTEQKILAKLLAPRGNIIDHHSTTGEFPIHYTRKLSYFVQILDFVPRITDDKGRTRPPSELKSYRLDTSLTRDAFLAAFNSSLFYWYLTVYSDCRNLNRRELDRFPLELARVQDETHQRLAT